MVSEEVRRQLRWVKVSDADLDLSRFPAFLILGPQRTGTTWLHAHLRYHPRILLAEPKELFFFSSLKTRDPSRFVSDELSWYLHFFQEPLWLRGLKMGRSLWKYREPYAPWVRGEATASYAVLDGDVIADIAVLNPGLKAVLMVRNPVERAWSHAKKDLVRNRSRRLDDVSEAEFHAFFTDPYQLRCARYTDQFDRWSAHLRPGNVFVGAFDDIARRPAELLLEVMRFLGVRADRRYLDGSVYEPVNPTGAIGIPERYRVLLADLFKDELINLRERFGWSWAE